VTGEYPSAYTTSSFWIGLDGWGTSNVVQAGTRQDVVTGTTFGGAFTINAYYPWAEWFPYSEMRLTGLSVTAGDELIGAVWVGGPTDTAHPLGSYGYYYLENTTTHTYVRSYVTAPPIIIFGNCLFACDPFRGASAEWVMERPTVNGSLLDLSNYGNAVMTNGFAVQASGKLVYPSSSEPSVVSVTMVNGSTKLSTARPIWDGLSVFTWLAFH
jgi:hypothetical protein